MFEIGTSLREARMRQGLDFEEMEARTKVRAKYLRALEEERFDQLPGHTYIKGFLRIYADALGLDGQLYVDEYNSRYVAGEEERPPRRAAPRAPGAPRRRRERRESRLVVVALAAIVARHGARDRRLAVRRPRRPAGARASTRAPSAATRVAQARSR